ncbi:inositol oxygenase-like [Daphnia carinata]|uniref:inositol oxygenase-like n=1 Tax=Daphnia carinata TaxID=120202 RepID=UPI00257F7240|nr:inositol oxygenase-like [Daphnia carinata]
MRIIAKHQVECTDISRMIRPEPIFANKPIEAFRQYDGIDSIHERVFRTYKLMHTYQTTEFAQGKLNEWCKFDRFSSTIMEALERLNNLVDESDPDSDLPNIVHAFQTAERIRESHPDRDWFHLTGLIHDLGKVMAFYEPQWAVVGDTFVCGAAFAPSIVYRSNTFDENPDLNDPRYNTEYGIYFPKCGLDKVTMSWGHDEYLYRVLRNHGTTLPDEALYMVRYHSFYPWHSGGDYMHLCSERDLQMLPWVREFNEFDLYTKSDSIPDVKALTPYYQSLIDKYIPGIVLW